MPRPSSDAPDAPYAALTRHDPSWIKRWVQERRLGDAQRLAAAEPLERVVDYGAGDGEMALRLLASGRAREVFCFEPAAELRAQAAPRLSGVRGAHLLACADEIPDGWAQTTLCLEVFEHLPPAQTEQALGQLERILAPGGALIVGVPVEVGAMALAKGSFRFLRRPGAADTRWRDIAAATWGRPSDARPCADLGDGLAYYPFHLGFDHRALFQSIAARFRIERTVGSPLPRGPAWLQSELYLLARKPEA